jgi:NitT/TauT family transport system permease protein
MLSVKKDAVNTTVVVMTPKTPVKRKLKVMHWISPNSVRNQSTEILLICAWIGMMVFAWISFGAKYLPSPMEVIQAFPVLWFQEGMGIRLWDSMQLNLTSIAIMFSISYPLSILSVTPAGAALAKIVSLGRFNGFVGLPIVFMSVFHSHADVKVALLVFGMGVFTVLSLTKMIENIPKDLFDHSRTLRMSEWRVVWEVVVLGTMDQVIDIIAVNVAMGWMMLPMVEGRFRDEGGIGAMMEIENKYLKLDRVFCALFVIMLIGFFQDAVIKYIKKLACPYASLGMERS